MDESTPYKVVVVGAGLAGVGCAHELITSRKVKPSEIIVLEAQDYIGGRVNSDYSCVDGMALEMGAEIIHHGEHRCIKDLADAVGAKREEFFCTSQGDSGPGEEPVNGGIGIYCVKQADGSIKWYDYNSQDDDYIHANRTLMDLCDLTPADSNCSMLGLLKKKNVKEDFIKLFESGYANTYCSTLSEMAVEKMVDWDNYYEENSDPTNMHETVFLPPYSFKSLVNVLVEQTELTSLKPSGIRLNTPVESIDYSQEDYIRVTTSDGQVFKADAVVISVPPSVLKAEMIHFTPRLPDYKIQALSYLNFEPTMKIHLQFKKPFWPENVHGMTCGGFEIPEVWFRKQKKDVFFCSGLIGAHHARRFAPVSDEEVINQVLHQMEVIFGDFAKRSNIPFEPESVKKNFVNGFVHRWDERTHPYIRGGYHCPKWIEGKKFDTGYGEKLARSVDSKLFFCGEATNVDFGCTTQSALLSGRRVAKELNSILD